MATAVKKNTIIGVETEVTEGTYVAPSAVTSYVQTLADGLEMNPSKELLERNIFNTSIGVSSPRVGMTQIAGSIPVEFKANSAEGIAPEYDKLLKSAMGSSRLIGTTTTTKVAGNTGSVLAIEDADISKFNVNDIILVKQSGAYHVSPISAKSSGVGTATITLLVPKPSGSFSNSVVIAKAINYTVADSGHPSLSISKYTEDAVLDKAVGCKVGSFSVENFATGQLPSINFSFEGLSHDQTLTPTPHTPTYDSALPPIILGGGVFMNGTAKVVNEVTLSFENTLAYKTSIAAANGRIASRATERRISGTFNPYKEDDSIDSFTKFQNNTAFSLFVYASVPTAVAGQFNQVVAIYLPNCIITELGETDQDGLLQEAISFSANRGTSGSTDEIFIGFI